MSALDVLGVAIVKLHPDPTGWKDVLHGTDPVTIEANATAFEDGEVVLVAYGLHARGS